MHPVLVGRKKYIYIYIKVKHYLINALHIRRKSHKCTHLRTDKYAYSSVYISLIFLFTCPVYTDSVLQQRVPCFILEISDNNFLDNWDITMAQKCHAGPLPRVLSHTTNGAET